MGIGGGSQIIEILPNGLYNRNDLKCLNLYVDGELIRYKGQFKSNMVARCPEEAIAHSSFLYLRQRVDMLNNYLGKTFNNIYVFMDGKRVQNKIQRVYHSGINDFETRNYFKHLCHDNKYTVVQLDEGESELQMYIKRDKHANLNVFLTRDSDMLTILYSHKPSIVQTNDTSIPCLDFTTKFEDKSTCIVSDRNEIYQGGNWIISDSCVWALCDMQKIVGSITTSTPITMIGFDFSEQRIGFNALVWRSYCVLCGTDFTPPLFTSTMRKSALKNLKPQELEILNEITNDVVDNNCSVDQFSRDVIMKIVVTLLISAMRCGSLKKKTNAEKVTYGEFNNFIDEYFEAIRTYFIYIKTGIMPPFDIPKLEDPYNCIINIFQACRNGQKFDLKKYKQWAMQAQVNECFNNIANYKPYLVKVEKCKRRKIKYFNSYEQGFPTTEDNTNDEVIEIIKC